MRELKIYTGAELTEMLNGLNQWELKTEALEKKFAFKNFSEALAFIVRVGIEAEKADHHPEISNVYNKVQIRWSTHDPKGITDLDFELAKKTDALL